MVSVYFGMLLPMIAFLATLGIAIYLLTKTVRHSLSLFNADTQSKIERRKLPGRSLHAETT